MEIKIEDNVLKFIDKLQKPTIAKTLRVLDLLEEFGHQLGMPFSKYIRKDVYELRIRGKQEIRLFYTTKNNTAYLVHGFIKKSQRTPQMEIETALQRIKTIRL